MTSSWFRNFWELRREGWVALGEGVCFLKILKVPLWVNMSLGTASVFCVSLDPKTNTLAVTGGEDDKAFVWRLSDGELLFECAGEGGHAGSMPGVGAQKAAAAWSVGASGWGALCVHGV